MSEEPSIVYGRLEGYVHVAGYTFERAWQQLEWLLEEHRWQHVGPGYTDINAFLATITLPEGVTPERRKKVAAQIKALEPEASQRKIAGVLGVDQKTVSNDLKPAEEYSSPGDKSLQGHKPPSATTEEHSSLSPTDGATVAREAEHHHQAHVSRNSGEQEWYTPPEYLHAARQVLGSIALDPASTPEANAVVQAQRFFTAMDDGLLQPWAGTVWLNPPYAPTLIGLFLAKLRRHLEAGDVPAALVLVNNATETLWFSDFTPVVSAACFPRGRVRFVSPHGEEGTPLQGQAVLYSGPDVSHFATVFIQFGHLWRRL